MRVYFVVFLIFSSLFISACIPENNYRGVPEPKWQKLTAEQKQLIVDQSYEADIHGVK